LVSTSGYMVIFCLAVRRSFYVKHMDQARTLLSSTAVLPDQTSGLLLPALQI
jgi:hypothetical protein